MKHMLPRALTFGSRDKIPAKSEPKGSFMELDLGIIKVNKPLFLPSFKTDTVCVLGFTATNVEIKKFEFCSAS